MTITDAGGPARTRLHELYDVGGQSPWLDNLRRDYLATGRLHELVTMGVRGVTSNPTIFAKAIETAPDYDAELHRLLVRGPMDDEAVERAYWHLVLDDIRAAARVLRPIYDASGGEDGFVSVEVSPALAHDADATVTSARELAERAGEPNVFVKVPATLEGVEAIRRLVALGTNVNVTLLFSLERYDAVIDAYLGGLEERVAAGHRDLASLRSVASFFVSRVDTEVDRRLEQLATNEPDAAEAARALRGKAAVAQAKQAYQLFRRRFFEARFERLRAFGANLQRPLWASTSTKNPAYPDLAYVEPLIGPDTVNTMPDQTLEAFLHHGTVARRVEEGIEEAAAALGQLGELGVDLADVAATLELQGVQAFSQSFAEALDAVARKAGVLSGARR
jgi:transaldolase